MSSPDPEKVLHLLSQSSQLLITASHTQPFVNISPDAYHFESQLRKKRWEIKYAG